MELPGATVPPLFALSEPIRPEPPTTPLWLTVTSEVTEPLIASKPWLTSVGPL